MPSTRPNPLTGERMGFGRMVWRFSGLMALAAAFVGLSAGRATAASVSCGDVLTHSAKLQSDLNCPGDGVIIGADRITLNLNGHTLRGPICQQPYPECLVNTGEIGIEDSGYDRVRIVNGTVLGFERSVLLAGADGNTLSHLNVFPSPAQDEHRVGLILSDSWNNVIVDSSIGGGDPAVFLRASSRRNKFLRTGMGGFRGVHSGDGMVIEGKSNANRVIDSGAGGNGFGLRIDSSSGNQLIHDGFDAYLNAIDLNRAAGMVIKRNTASGGTGSASPVGWTEVRSSTTHSGAV